MKITLVRPPFISLNNGPPIGLAYIAGTLKNAGHDANVVDLNLVLSAEHPFKSTFSRDFTVPKSRVTDYAYANLRRYCDQVLDQKPDIVGFSLSYSTVAYGIEMAKYLSGKVRCIVGGPQAAFGEQKLLDTGYFDTVVSSYGEEGVIKALDTKGIILDRLIKGKEYTADYSGITPDMFQGRLSVVTTRGCPHNCAFCTQNHPYYYHSIESVVKHIQEMTSGFSTKTLMYNDSNINIDGNRTRELFKEIAKLRLPAKGHVFGMEVTKDSPEYIHFMSEANVKEIRVGIESGSLRERDSMNKHKFTNDMVVETLKEIGKNKIVAWAQFIFCYPDQTDEDRRQTLDLMHRIRRECDPRYVKMYWFKFVVHHGTEDLFRNRHGVVAESPANWRNKIYDSNLIKRLKSKYSKLTPKNCKMML